MAELLSTVSVELGGVGRLGELGKSVVDRRLLEAGVESIIELSP